MFTYLREALTARFIAKGIPEPLFMERVVIQTLTLFVYNRLMSLMWRARYGTIEPIT